MVIIKKIYPTYLEIVNSKNLLFNLKNDWTFKNVFLNKISFNYICYVFSVLFKFNYNDLLENLRIISGEIPSGISGNNNAYTDIMFEYKNIRIILEMNYSNKKVHINKNYYYLFLEHSSRLNNKNNYDENLKTILVNIDSYDVLGFDEMLYNSKLLFSLYNKNIYKGIEIIHINLDYLENKYYNEDVLNEFENSMLIFIENDYYKLKKIIKRKDVQDIVEFMNGLKFNKNGIPTYDYDEFKRIEELEGIRNKEQLETERKILENEKNELENQKSEIATQKSEIATQKSEIATQKSEIETQKSEIETQKSEIEIQKNEIETQLNEIENNKLELAREMKEEGFSVNKILKITKLSKNQIMML